MHSITVKVTAPRKPSLWRKIGGIHWIALGRIRISFCMTRKPPMWEVFHVLDGTPIFRTVSERRARIIAHIHGDGFDYALTGEGW